MRCLIIANESDYTARAVAQLLRQRHGTDAVQLRSINEIVFAPYWEHEVSDTGTQSRVRFHDGSSLSDFRPTVVLNRLDAADIPASVGTHPMDKEYGRLEWGALLLSWLNSMDIPVVNPPTAGSLSGGAFRIAPWYQLARRAGLQVMPRYATTDARDFPPLRGYEKSGDGAYGWYQQHGEHDWCATDVVGSATFDAPSAEIGGACQRLAGFARVRMLQAVFCRMTGAQSSWRFHSATTTPDLRTDDRLLALVALLEREGRPA